MTLLLWTVDAFTSTPYRGNPAAVIRVEEFPEDAVAQAIAAEMNLSETAFIRPRGGEDYDIRWFTPTTEVKLCGHATLASAHILWEEGFVQGEHIAFSSLSGVLHVYREKADLVLDFPLQPVTHALDIAVFAPLFLPENMIVQAVQAQDDIIVEIRDAAYLKALVIDLEKVKQVPCRGLIVTAKGTPPYDFVSRFFAPRVGVSEDPVTGSAHCKLADYWSKKLGKKNMLAYQASKRGGVIALEIRGDRVLLKGNAVTIMKGQWRPGLHSL